VNEFYYFSCPVYRTELPGWVDQVLAVTQKHYDKSREEFGPSVVVQTYNLTADPELSFISNYFRDTCVEILSKQGYRTDLHDFYTSSMWGQEFGCYGSNLLHVHGNTLMSGFYFLETPEGGPYPIFEDPRPAKLMCDLPLKDYENVYVATPGIHFNNLAPGSLLVANSWLPHRFQMSQSEKPAKFIHFTISAKDKQQCNMC